MPCLSCGSRLKKSDVALIVEYDIFEENGRLRARPISKMIMCKICGFVLIKKGGEGDLLPSLTQGASTVKLGRRSLNTVNATPHPIAIKQ